MPKRPHLAVVKDAQYHDALGELRRLRRLPTAPVFTVGAISQRTGIAPATLRAWERRHGLLHPIRTDSEYRLYSEQDVALVLWARDRIEDGLSIGQVCALIQSYAVCPTAAEFAPPPIAEHATPLEGGVADHASPSTEPTRDARRVAQLLQAFAQFDEPLAEQRVGEVFAVYTVEQALTTVVAPTLAEIGVSWERGDTVAVAVEHFAVGVLRNHAHMLLRAAPGPTTGPLVVLGASPGEAHELGCLFAALILRRAGIRAIALGQDNESSSLIAMIDIIQPAMICLSASMACHVPKLVDAAQRIEARGGVRVGYAGRIFEVDPGLRVGTPGIYLGSIPEQYVERVRVALRQSPLTCSGEREPC